jgi:cytochrome c-type biogenesis protein CcmH
MKMMMKKLRATHVKILAVVICFGGALTAMAQGQATERKDIAVDQEQFKDVAGDLRCPTCTGLSVLDSDAAFSVQIKNEVRSQLASGKSKDDILTFFTERYGPWILREPPKEGVHLLAWIVPLMVLILGPILIFAFVWRRRSNEPSAGAVSAEGSMTVSMPVEEAIREMNERLTALRGGRHV